MKFKNHLLSSVLGLALILASSITFALDTQDQSDGIEKRGNRRPNRPVVNRPNRPHRPNRPVVNRPNRPHRPNRPVVNRPHRPHRPNRPVVNRPNRPHRPNRPVVNRPHRPHRPNRPVVNRPNRPHRPNRPVVNRPHRPHRPNRPVVNRPHRPHRPNRPVVNRPHRPHRPNRPVVNRPHRPHRPNRPVVNRPHRPHRRTHWHTRRNHMRRHFRNSWGHRRFRPIRRNYVYYVSRDYHYNRDYGYGTYPLNADMTVVNVSSLNIRKYAALGGISKVCGSVPRGADVYVKAVVSTYSDDIDWAMVPVSDISRYIDRSDCFNGDYVYLSMRYLDYRN